MLSRIIAASVFSLILFVLNRIFALRRNIRVAKQTNVFLQSSHPTYDGRLLNIICSYPI